MPRSVPMLMQRGRRDDLDETPASDCSTSHTATVRFGDLDHHPIHFRFEKIGSAQAVVHIESVDSQKQQVSIQPAQSLSAIGPQGKRILAQSATRKDDFHCGSEGWWQC